MGKRLDLVGERFNRLKVIKFTGTNKQCRSQWLCKCDCGNKVIVSGHHLRIGNTQSCGCLNRELASKRLKGHTPWNKNKPCSKEIKNKISKTLIGKNDGENNPNYKHGLRYTKEYIKEHNKQWNKDNKDKVNAHGAKRRAIKLDQTPILTDLENDKTLMYYKIREYLGSEWHVDHIIPLSKGGLHHPDNLQVTTKKYNLQKHNNLNFRAPTTLEYIKI